MITKSKQNLMINLQNLIGKMHNKINLYKKLQTQKQMPLIYRNFILHFNIYDFLILQLFLLAFYIFQ